MQFQIDDVFSTGSSRAAARRRKRRQLRRADRWHTAIFSSAVASTAKTQVNALADSVLRIDANNGFLMPYDMMLLAALGVGNILNECDLESPKIIQTNPLFIRGINTGVELPANPYAAYFGPQWMTLRGQEDLLAYAINSAGTSTQTSVIVWMTDQIEPLPAGQIYTIKATATTAAVAYTWSQIQYSLATALPAGQYALVGSDVISTTAIAHRWFIQNQFLRPGFPSSTALNNITWDVRRLRLLGQMGVFFQYNLPTLEVFCQTTDNSHTIYMDVIKIG